MEGVKHGAVLLAAALCSVEGDGEGPLCRDGGQLPAKALPSKLGLGLRLGLNQLPTKYLPAIQLGSRLGSELCQRPTKALPAAHVGFRGSEVRVGGVLGWCLHLVWDMVDNPRRSLRPCRLGIPLPSHRSYRALNMQTEVVGSLRVSSGWGATYRKVAFVAVWPMTIVCRRQTGHRHRLASCR